MTPLPVPKPVTPPMSAAELRAYLHRLAARGWTDAALAAASGLSIIDVRRALAEPLESVP